MISGWAADKGFSPGRSISLAKNTVLDRVPARKPLYRKGPWEDPRKMGRGSERKSESAGIVAGWLEFRSLLVSNSFSL